MLKNNSADLNKSGFNENKNLLPKLSVVIPSLNQGKYIEETLTSVINQNYPNLELIVMDGGSTDNSTDIIKKYEHKISYWVSEKDEGQSDAINKGFERATGEYIAWINADDIYYEGAFLKIFSDKTISENDFIFGPVCTGTHSSHVTCVNSDKNNILSVFNLLHFFYSSDYIIPSQSVFIRREFLEKNNISLLDKHSHYCMDMEWYCRIVLCSPKYTKYNYPVSFFRVNDASKTTLHGNKMQKEAIQVLLNYRKYLSKTEQVRLFNLLFLHRALHRLFKVKAEIKLGKLLNIFFRVPREAGNDRRFLGLVKKSFFKTIGFAGES